jgi:predicted PurR-regulated permease PerM
MIETRPDLTRTTLAIFCIIGLIGLSVWVLRPFLAATVWATMIVVATWPLLKMLEAHFGNRRAPAVTVMTVGMLLLLVLPLWLAIDTISEHSDQLTAAGHHIAENGLPKPPNWVATLPLVGERIATLWTQLAASGRRRNLRQDHTVCGRYGEMGAFASRWSGWHAYPVPAGRHRRRHSLCFG